MRMTRRVLPLAMLALAGTLGVRGARALESEGERARAVIRRQMGAFAREDAEAAYALASPAIRRAFRTPEHFVEMVRRAYPPVYRPAGIVFGAFRREGTMLVQDVRLVGADAGDYLAIYTLEEQPDGSLAISGCRLSQIEGRAI